MKWYEDQEQYIICTRCKESGRLPCGETCRSCGGLGRLPKL